MDNKLILKRLRVKNFLSLRDIQLDFKPLTILIGPNASGKTNILMALDFLNQLIRSENLPSVDYFKNLCWIEGNHDIEFELIATINNIDIHYFLKIGINKELNLCQVIKEKLVIKNLNIIDIENGIGKVCDEDGKNEIEFSSNTPQVALKSVGNYGNKPITRDFGDFIKKYKIFNFDPDQIRTEHFFLQKIKGQSKNIKKEPQLGSEGKGIIGSLFYWNEKHSDYLELTNQALKNSINRFIEFDESEVYLNEGFKIPLEKASEGTIRMIAYQVLLNASIIPPLIALEEPERNLHPAALKEVANILEKLSERTQVLVTTHSSQILDFIDTKKLNDKIGIKLLSISPATKEGTVIINLEEYIHDIKSLQGWIQDFGIGSAIFESDLIPTNQ